MKKILAMVMIAGLLFTGTVGMCFADDAETASADVTVTAILDAAFDISEKLTIHGVTYDQELDVSDLRVTNLTTDKTIKVENVTAVASGTANWALSSLADVNAAAQDSKYIYLYMENTDLRSGCVPSDGEITGENVFKDFAIDGNVPEQSHPLAETEVAKLIVTISVYDIGSSSGSSGGSGTSGGSTGKTYTTEELKKVTWADGKPEEIIAVIQAIDAGTLQVDDLTGWDVGDERTVTLPAMEAGVVDESHEEQDIVVVIMDKTDAAATKTLESDSSKHASFIIGLKNCLNTGGDLNSSAGGTGAETWGNTTRRQWCNDTFYKAMLSAFGAKKSDNFFKKVANITSNSVSSTIDTVYDYFAFPSAVEVLGEDASSSILLSVELNSDGLKQFTWYQQGNRAKTINGSITRSNGTTIWFWWLRSATSKMHQFALMYNDGDVGYESPLTDGGIAPFGCL